jgi:hypothetical protein
MEQPRLKHGAAGFLKKRKRKQNVELTIKGYKNGKIVPANMGEKVKK